MRIVRTASRGFSLMELLIASTLAGIVLVALGKVDLARFTMAETSNSDVALQADARYALAHIVRELQKADRVNLVNASSMQLRIPEGTNFDVAANYHWEQYWYTAQEIRFVAAAAGGAPNCGAPTTRFASLSSLTLAYTSNNVLAVTVTATSPRTGQVFTYAGEATLRAASGMDLNTGLTTQTGAGFDPPNPACS